MKQILLLLILACFTACSTPPTEEEKKELEIVEDLKAEDNRKADSMKKALGL